MHIDEIITDASGLRSYKFPQEEADRIERLLKGGDNSDINSDDELVENEEVSEEDSILREARVVWGVSSVRRE